MKTELLLDYPYSSCKVSLILGHPYIWLHYITYMLIYSNTHQQDTLPGHPPDWQHGLALYPVVIRAIEAATHAEIRDLDGEVMADKAVSRS